MLVVSFSGCGLLSYWLLNKFNMKDKTKIIKRKQMFQESIKDFRATQTFVNQNMAIAINQEEEELFICSMKDGTPVPLVYKFNDIIGSEIIEHAVTDTTASGSSHSDTENVERIDLKISIDDSQNPFVLANFLFWEASKESGDYQKALRDASRWHGIIDSIRRKS